MQLYMETDRVYLSWFGREVKRAFPKIPSSLAAIIRGYVPQLYNISRSI